VLLHTMKAFERHPLIDDIYVVCSPEWDNYVRMQAKVGVISKFCHTITSGATSHESLFNGVCQLNEAAVGEDTIVMVHEAVRPFLSYNIISNNVHTCIEKGNAVTAIYSHESYLQTNDGMVSKGYISREKLMRTQTPLTFRMKDLMNIIKESQQRGISTSQSLFTLVNELGQESLNIVEGSMLNFKITLPLDVEIYQRLKDINCD